MNGIISIADALSWYLREVPLSAKFTSEITTKVNRLISNQIVINDYLENLLVGSSIEATHPATVPMFVPSSPTGWTRSTDILNDQVLTISNSSGLSSGGSWAISGIIISTDGGHTHTTGNHFHDISHSHSSVVHNHSISHTHNFIHTHIISLESVTTGTAVDDISIAVGRYSGLSSHTFRAFNSTGIGDGHSHIYQHQHDVSEETVTLGTATSSNSTSNSNNVYSSYSGNSSVTNEDNTETSGSHTHDVFGDSSWRPRYSNMIVCKKD